MPKFNSNSLTKRLDLSHFFDGEEAYIYVKKIPRSDMVKIEMYEESSLDKVAYSSILELYQNKMKRSRTNIVTDKHLKEVQKEIIKVMNDKCQKMSDEEIENITKRTKMAHDLLIDLGVDKDNHNFTTGEGEDEKEISLDSVTINIFFSSEALKFIVDGVKAFNNDFSMVKLSGKV